MQWVVMLVFNSVCRYLLIYPMSKKENDSEKYFSSYCLHNWWTLGQMDGQTALYCNIKRWWIKTHNLIRYIIRSSIIQPIVNNNSECGNPWLWTNWNKKFFISPYEPCLVDIPSTKPIWNYLITLDPTCSSLDFLSFINLVMVLLLAAVPWTRWNQPFMYWTFV